MRFSDLRNGEFTRSCTVEGIERLGRQDPFVPPDIGKVHLQVPPGTAARFFPLSPPSLLHGFLIKPENLRLAESISMLLAFPPTFFFKGLWLERKVSAFPHIVLFEAVVLHLRELVVLNRIRGVQIQFSLHTYVRWGVWRLGWLLVCNERVISL